jgi:glycogen operon protein
LAGISPGAELITYVARLAAIRREHEVLRAPVFLHGRAHPAPGIADIAWFDEGGGIISAEAWNDGSQRTLVLRRVMSTPEGKATILTLLLNPTDEHRRFHLPAPHFPTRVVLDSAAGIDEHDVDGQYVSVTAHSAMLLYAEYGDARE